jgi:hypothetical protein
MTEDQGEDAYFKTATGASKERTNVGKNWPRGEGVEACSLTLQALYISRPSTAQKHLTALKGKRLLYN